MTESNFLQSVKDQYETLPYPTRVPADEKNRLIHTVGGSLVTINHHCFRAKKDFSAGFRCLIAGGGTGDCLIYLAEQLRNYDAEIVYLDFSMAARRIAEERARVRGLTNISWITDSIMEIPHLQLGKFDFINCAGVLHHLESTEDGLATLSGALKPNGAMYLMLYGKYGRHVVYGMQSLLRDYLPKNAGMRRKIAMTRQLLASLPETNSFKQDLERWEKELSHDAGLFDLLLHSQDRCFTVDEIYDLAESAGLSLLGFAGNRVIDYDLSHQITANMIPEHLTKLGSRAQHSVAEKICSNIGKHELFLGNDSNATATFDAESNTLLAVGDMHQNAPKIAASMIDGNTITYRDTVHCFKIKCSPVAKLAFSNMDGRMTIKALVEQIAISSPTLKKNQIRDELREIFDILHPRGYLYLLSEGSHGIRIPDYGRMLKNGSTLGN